MKRSETLERMTPVHPPKKPFKTFLRAEIGLLVVAVIVGILAYISTQR